MFDRITKFARIEFVATAFIVGCICAQQFSPLAMAEDTTMKHTMGQKGYNSEMMHKHHQLRQETRQQIRQNWHAAREQRRQNWQTTDKQIEGNANMSADQKLALIQETRSTNKALMQSTHEKNQAIRDAAHKKDESIGQAKTK